jgi:hyperosmotically inducible protein
MMKLKIATSSALVMTALVVMLYGCQKPEGPAEKAGQKIDKAVERTGEKIDQTTEKVGEKVERAGEDIKDSAKNTEKK